ncbi:ParB N-terminal domain-containing protein [Candidatus Bathyarchaeota archaeon]|nr:ParB N-terminal domain-containing protein [Candidatus Bathyarchaeota archaeon]
MSRTVRIQEINMKDVCLNPIELIAYQDKQQQKRIANMAHRFQIEEQREPIYINENYTVIWRGHTRYLAARRLGWKLIKAIILTAEEWQAHCEKNPEEV